MSDPRYPALYQINTRVWLTELSKALGHRATLDDVPDVELDRLVEMGFDWIWLLSVWQTGPAAQAISRANPAWRREFAETLPDLADADIAGSGFAIHSYTAHRDLGGTSALARLRQRLQSRGLKLMLDFVPNHMAPDHPWIDEHPDYFVHGTEGDLSGSPENYCRVQTKERPLVFAHGRDPYFDGWPDTLQLNYGNPELQRAMIDELERIAAQCDGVRCDMAMLVLPDVFERTWGIQADPFWPRATESVRSTHPHFLFMAEVYWDLEWTMQQQGFDYAYDKRLYDRLRDGHARPVRQHFQASLDYQLQLCRFLENHDEPRAAATFSPERPRGGGGHYIPVARAADVQPRSIPRLHQTHFPPFDPRAGGADRPEAGAVLRKVSGRAASASDARGKLAIAGMSRRLGGQLDVRLLPALCLAGPW